jgi:hypothetical protein
MDIKNNTDKPIPLPNGLTIPANGTASVPDWESVSKNAIVKAWLKARLIEAVEPVKRGGYMLLTDPAPVARFQTLDMDPDANA